MHPPILNDIEEHAKAKLEPAPALSRQEVDSLGEVLAKIERTPGITTKEILELVASWAAGGEG